MGKTLSFYVKLNGKILKKSSPSRGFGQGGPLSPYLFLFVAEGLSSLLQQQIKLNNIPALQICRKSHRISHLLFADDGLFFQEKMKRKPKNINGVLRAYESRTRHLMLGQFCMKGDGKKVVSILNVGSTSFDDKYLGLPIPKGRMKHDNLQSNKEKLRKKCLDWCEKYMSSAAKETLVKSVAQVITTH
jgi:hypothetical protein